MDLIIIGAGGFAKEIIFLVERNNFFAIKGFVDDKYQELPEEILGYPVLGGIGLSEPDKEEYGDSNWSRKT